MKKIIFVYYSSLGNQSNGSVHNLLFNLSLKLSQNNLANIIVPNYSEQANEGGNIISIKVQYKNLKYMAAKFLHKLFRFRTSNTSDLLINSYLSAVKKNIPGDKIFLIVRDSDVIKVRKQFPGSKVIYWVHSLPKTYGQKPFYNDLLNNIDVLLVPSWSIYDRLFKAYESNCLTCKVIQIPNSSMPLRVDKEFNTTKAIGVTNEIKFIFLQGNGPHKGAQLVLDIVRKLNRLILNYNKNVFFYCIGSLETGKYEDDLEIVDDNIVIKHYPNLSHKDLQRLILSCDYSLVPSLWFENAPLFLIESISNGCIPVCNSVGGIEEITSKEYHFLVDNAGSVLDWVEIINKAIITDSEKRERIIKKLSEHLRTVYTRKDDLWYWKNMIIPLLT